MVRQRSFGSCDVPVVGGIRREREVVGQGLVSVEYHRAIDLAVPSIHQFNNKVETRLSKAGTPPQDKKKNKKRELATHDREV